MTDCLTVALPLTGIDSINISKPIEQLRQGFLPFESMASRSIGKNHSSDTGYRIIFKAPSTAKNAPTINLWPGLPIQPEPFIDYLMHETTWSVLFDRTGAVVVSLPSPARYAMYKLLSCGHRQRKRPAATTLEQARDLWQAAMLITALARYREQDLNDAWADARA